jgi:hypothetical protein
MRMSLNIILCLTLELKVFSYRLYFVYLFIGKFTVSPLFEPPYVCVLQAENGIHSLYISIQQLSRSLLPELHGQSVEITFALFYGKTSPTSTLAPLDLWLPVYLIMRI